MPQRGFLKNLILQMIIYYDFISTIKPVLMSSTETEIINYILTATTSTALIIQNRATILSAVKSLKMDREEVEGFEL